MKRVNFVLVLCLVGVVFFTSCMVRDIREMEIGTVEIKLRRGDVGVHNLPPFREPFGYAIHPVHSDMPFNIRCKLKVSVFDPAGKEIFWPDHRNFSISSPNGSFKVLRYEKRYIILGTDIKAFKVIEKGDFRMQLHVRGNPFSSSEYRWDVDWGGLPQVVDYSGANGEDGKMGKNGITGPLISFISALISKSSDRRSSASGGDGGDGRPGEDGPNVTLIAAYYALELPEDGQSAGKRLLLLFNPDNGDWFLSNLSGMTIDVSGGAGGDGGSGGNGERATSYTDSSGKTVEVPAGRPGRGGDGARGGDGGSIELYYSSRDILNHINFNVRGGSNGRGGSAGSGTIREGEDLSGDSPGYRSSNGYYDITRFSFEEIKMMLKKIKDRDFNLERVVE